MTDTPAVPMAVGSPSRSPDRPTPPRRPSVQGFTLVELLVVVTILAMLASVGTVQLLRVRITTNEQLALVNLRGISRACQFYLLVQGIYPVNLTVLGTPASQPPYLNADLIGNGITVAKQSYVLTYTQQDSGRGFTLVTDPQQPGTSGIRHFYIDQTNTIYVNSSGPAGPTDPVIP